MTKNATRGSPRSEAIGHLKAALATGVRGAARAALQASLDVLLEADDKGGDITDLHIRRLKARTRLFDPKRPGLIVRMGADGKSAMWMYRYRALDGSARQIELRFGQYPEMSLAEARAIWSGLRAARLKGQTPTLAAGAGAGKTVADLIDRYLTEYSQRVKAPLSVRADTRLLAQLRASHGAVPVSAFGPDQAALALRPLIERGVFVDAARLKAAAQAMWNVGIKGSTKIDLGPERWLPPTIINPWLAVSVPKPKSEGTYVPRDFGELRRFTRAIAALGEAGDALWLQALTGCRISEVTGARAFEVDLEARIWTIPASRMKANAEHRVMLSPPAWEVVQRRVEMAKVAGRDHLFTQATSDRMLLPDAAQKVLARLREGAGLSEGFTTHAMRRAMATWVAEHGATKDVRDRLLAHVDRASVDARYSRAALDRPAAEWWGKWADFLFGLRAETVIRIDEAGRV